ncbi:hypothetical protein [Geminicoccus roseus]|uniref:hypothetical protein n=1 Tax=Geminicoccus roseus TaxID=404900 RepID=UPI0004098343|nr:hypothetical protein [Geminicoccus roseus]
MPAMEVDATMRLVDAALLGTLYDRARMVGRAVDGTRALCRPWLDPGDSFVLGRVEIGLRDGVVALAGQDRDLVATPAGRQRLEDELCRPLDGRPCHQFRVLQEQLRLCFIGLLPPERRALLAARMRQDRQRCLSCLGERGERLPDGPERRLVLERRRMMAAETAVLDQRLAALGLPSA